MGKKIIIQTIDKTIIVSKIKMFAINTPMTFLTETFKYNLNYK